MKGDAHTNEGWESIRHPLPILNISEHLTRVSLQKKDPNVRSRFDRYRDCAQS